MSVAFANQVVAGLRAHGVPVKFHPGWESRGNGQSSAYQGLIWHHTATGFSVNAPSILVNGRPDLSGPLCNTSGNSDGSVTLIAANPANHAGASGGRSMGPLPRTGSFNRIVWGHEIVYPGVQPMTDAQYRTATILGAVVSQILGRPNADWCRGHMETSITGKWDPGYANGKTYDLNKMRADTVAVMRGGRPPATSDGDDELDANQARMLAEIHRESTQRLKRRIGGSTYSDTVMGYAMNADSYGYRATEALARLEAQVERLNERIDAWEKRDAA